ncbi:MAG: putative sensor with domain [Herbinix sp.]|jgi:sensor histidine kinase YesM|nr:putative sensor with domain [Herbinix sp.]
MKKSFVNEILIFLMILTGLLTGILGIFLASSYNILENEIKASSEAFLKIYSNEFSNNIAEMDNLLKSITTQGEDLSQIKSSNGNKRALAAISLSNYLQDLLSGRDITDVMVVYDNNYEVCLDAITNGFNFKQKNMLRDFTGKAIENDDIDNYEWNFLNLENETYLYKMLITDSRAIALYIRTGKLLRTLSTEENGNRSIVLVNDKGVIGKLWGNETEEIKVGLNIKDINAEGYFHIGKNIVEDQLSIYCYTGKNGILKQTDTSVIIVAVAAFVAVFFILFILHFTRKEIANPMQHMIGDMERIKNGEYENRVGGSFHTKEFLMLQDATNKMVDEIVGLKIQSYEKRIELQDMELKSIRLQLKPHFFLNALTTISSLSSQSKNEHIKTYIDALSRNVRYMFRAGFHTVPVREEIKHVKNYFEMQELKYPECIFYLIDMPQELEEWKIPQMLIHTFIENEFKYAVSIDETLTILIKISQKTYQGQEMLLIEIEDDGKGYPEEVLDYMSGRTENNSEKGTRLGLWSINRMMELMYEMEHLLILENIKPHGCLNRIYIPQKAKHELVAETIHLIEK